MEQGVNRPRKMKKLSKIKGQGDFRKGGSAGIKTWHKKLEHGGDLKSLLASLVKVGDLSIEDVNQFSDALRNKQRIEAEKQKENND